MRKRTKITVDRCELLRLLRTLDSTIPDDAEISVDTGDYYRGTVMEGYPLEIEWEN